VSIAGANDGSASGENTDSLGWIDTFTIVSSSLPANTPVQLKLTATIQAKMAFTPNLASTWLSVQFLDVNSGSNTIPISFGQAFDITGPMDSTITQTALLNVSVGQVVLLGGLMSVQTTAGIFSGEASANAQIGPSDGTLSSYATYTLNIDPATPGVCYTTASGMPYYTQQNAACQSTPASVSITDTSDIKDGVVGVQLNGSSGSSGNLVLDLQGKNKASQTFPSLAAGAQKLDLTLDDIDPDTYTSAMATWTPGGSSVASPEYNLPKPWAYFEEVRYSQYNEPSESECPEGEAKAWLVTTKCDFTEIRLRPQFISQTWMNGTGTSEDYGILKNAAAVHLGDQSGPCKGKYPPGAIGHGATDGNTFEVVSKLTGSCNTKLEGNKSAAVPKIPLSGVVTLECKDTLNLDSADTNVTKYNRTAADKCTACDNASTFNGANGHIDSFSPQTSCQSGPGKLPDLGLFYSSKTN
jgi:hypothetical protein